MTEPTPASAPNLTIGVKWAVFLRSLSLQASWNNQRMQNLGLLATLLPWLRAQPRRLEHDRLFCRRYYEFFNTNPYLSNYLVGGLLRLEAERLAGRATPTGTVGMFRDSLGRALASLGDQLFWLGLRPAVTMVICLLGLMNHAAWTLAVVSLFAAVQMIWRWRALDRGFALGFDLVDLLARPGWHRAIAATKRTGMLLTGVTAGWYLARVGHHFPAGDTRPLAAVVGIGLVLPLLLRRRWPGEILVLVALVVSLVVSFAISPDGS